jgi:hypothetical protein
MRMLISVAATVVVNDKSNSIRNTLLAGIAIVCVSMTIVSIVLTAAPTEVWRLPPITPNASMASARFWKPSGPFGASDSAGYGSPSLAVLGT